jgi:hypothetical protein
MGDLSNYIKRRGNLNSISAADPGAPPLRPGLNEYVVRHFLKQLGILKFIHFIFMGTEKTYMSSYIFQPNL